MAKKNIFFFTGLLTFLATSVYTVTLPFPSDKIWAVLVAGSGEYSNYRHQADVCHAYQVLHEHGVPDEQIIVMMFDTIAYNPSNPTPGIVINYPAGSDVYHGVPKDYTGMTVTAENFVNILLGNEDAMRNVGSGKVLKSGPEDHVFINYVDHGGPGYLIFGNDYLSAQNFTTTLKEMHAKQLYKKMVVYIEACNAGSMIDLLPTDINIYVETASGATEQSMACCYDILRKTFVGDLFSVSWMQDSDTQDIRIETLDTQFAIVKQETVTSTVHRYGDTKIGKLSVGEFQGMNKSEKHSFFKIEKSDLVPSREVPLHLLMRRLETASTQEERSHLQNAIETLLENRAFMADKIAEIVKRSVKNDELFKQVLHEKMKLQDYQCYGEVLNYFSDHCFSLSKNEYVGTHVHTLINMCERGIDPKIMIEAMDETCTFQSIEGIN